MVRGLGQRARQLDVVEALQQDREGDLELLAGQGHADAEVGPAAEGEVVGGVGSPDVELLGSANSVSSWLAAPKRTMTMVPLGMATPPTSVSRW